MKNLLLKIKNFLIKTFNKKLYYITLYEDLKTLYNLYITYKKMYENEGVYINNIHFPLCIITINKSFYSFSIYNKKKKDFIEETFEFSNPKLLYKYLQAQKPSETVNTDFYESPLFTKQNERIKVKSNIWWNGLPTKCNRERKLFLLHLIKKTKTNLKRYE